MKQKKLKLRFEQSQTQPSQKKMKCTMTMEQVTRTFEEELSTVVIKTDIVIKINMSKLTTKHIQLTEAERAGGVMEVMKTNSTQSIMMSVKKKAKKK